MVELLGRVYVTEYVLNRFLEKEHEKLFKVYITDAIKYAYNLPIRYYDMAYTNMQEEEEEEEENQEETAEEIKNRIMDGLNRLGSNTEELE